MTILGSRLYVFGGKVNASSSINGVFCLNLDTLAWEVLPNEYSLSN